jgi:hypothetical protein
MRLSCTVELLALQHCGMNRKNLAILALDRKSDNLEIYFRTDWTDLDEPELDFLTELSAQSARGLGTQSATAFLEFLHEQYPGTIRVNHIQQLVTGNLETHLNRLQQELLSARADSPETRLPVQLLIHHLCS